MAWLAAIVPPSLLLLFLVSAETGAELDINARRRRESESLGHLDKVQLVDIKDRSEGVGRICLEVSSVPVFRGLHGR